MYSFQDAICDLILLFFYLPPPFSDLLHYLILVYLALHKSNFSSMPISDYEGSKNGPAESKMVFQLLACYRTSSTVCS